MSLFFGTLINMFGTKTNKNIILNPLKNENLLSKIGTSNPMRFSSIRRTLYIFQQLFLTSPKSRL